MESSQNSKRHEQNSSSLCISFSLCAIFIETVHETQSMLRDFLDFISNFPLKVEKTVHDT